MTLSIRAFRPICVALALFASAGVLAQTAVPKYRIYELSDLRWWRVSANRQGDIAFVHDDKSYLYQDGQAVRIPDMSWAIAMNERGQVVGYSSQGIAIYTNGRLEQIDVVGDSSPLVADINDAGALALTINRRPAVWRNGRIQFMSDDIGLAASLNNRGDLLVNYVQASLIYRSGVVEEIPMLAGGSPTSSFRVWATALNNKGVVVGVSSTGAFTNAPFVFDGVDTLPLEMPFVPIVFAPAPFTPMSINDAGIIVGNGRKSGFGGRGYGLVWVNRKAYFLEDLIDPTQQDVERWLISTAIQITNDGVIFGAGSRRSPSGIRYAVTYMAVPVRGRP